MLGGEEMTTMDFPPTAARTRCSSVPRRRTWRPALAATCLLSVFTLTGWGQAPKLVSSSPANGATGVPVTAELVFTFDLDMDVDVIPIPSVPPFLVGNIQITPAGSVIVDGSWSDNKRILTCTPISDLPPATTITWTLNPPGTSFPFTSVSGTPLATVSGSFTTGNGGGGGGAKPALVAANPANGSVGVPVSAAVTFIFDQPMKKDPAVAGAITWLGVGLDPAKFTYTWSADGTTLTCDYTGDFPTLTLVLWRLNPAGAAVMLESAAGEPLPADTYNGTFTTGQAGGGGCEPDGIPAEWGAYTLSKSGRYQQHSTADPVPVAEEPFQFAAFVSSPQAGPLATAGSVTLPDGTKHDLTPAPLGGFLMFFDTPANAAALEAAYPAGTYTLRFTQTGQSERVVPMPLSGANPPVPKVANHTEAQAVNPAQNFTLRWNAFTGASGQDTISIVVANANSEEVVFQAPDVCVPRELPVTATSIVIPAGTLASNQTYHATLTFNRVGYFQTNAVPQMAGFGGLTRSTEFTIKTGGGGPAPGAAARFTAWRLLPNGNPELTFTGTPAHTYTVQRATRLSAPDWANVGAATTDATGKGVFEDAQPGKQPPLYYRALTN